MPVVYHVIRHDSRSGYRSQLMLPHELVGYFPRGKKPFWPMPEAA
ncbi:hypothetical protein HMPREF1502_0714 [Klebsiella sp. AS10]|nr:hypothetical protein HMPREF1502_0714 [Klebsiella sp. AS10]